MKKVLILFCLFTFVNIAQSQTSNSQNTSRTSISNENPTSNRIESEENISSDETPVIALVVKEVDQSNFIYSFNSNKIFVEENVDRWEYRFKAMFISIINIELNAINQTIVLTLPNTHTEDELLEIIKRFNFTTYQIAD